MILLHGLFAIINDRWENYTLSRDVLLPLAIQSNQYLALPSTHFNLEKPIPHL